MKEIYDRLGDDRFAKHCGMQLEEIRPGYGRASMVVDDCHLNGVSIMQGGVVFTLMDLAFAAASNSHGPVALSINNSIDFIKAVHKGETLIAEAHEVSLHRKIATYEMEARSEGELVAKMTGTVYRKT